MNNLGLKQNLVRVGSKRIVQGSRKRGSNPEDSKTIRMIQG
jgi:hypothetical protein